MIVIQTPQGSPEWFQSRAGAVTASMFGEIRKRVGGLTDQQKLFVDMRRAGWSEAEAKAEAGYTKAPSGKKIQAALDGETVGDFSNEAHNYAFKLAVERISGQALDEGQYETWAARRGHELEPEARAIHEQRIGDLIERAGVVLDDDGLFGASADGLIGDDGGAEYKCFLDPAKLRSLLLDEDFSDVHDQIQGGMWLTGRKWWHLGLYCPALSPIGMDFTLYEFQRDDYHIAALEADLCEFHKLVERYRKQLTDKAQSGQEAA